MGKMIFLSILLFLFLVFIGFRFFQKKTFRILSSFAAPFVRLYIRFRIKQKLEIKERKNERFGIPSKTRPTGDLVWFHAVSVGETNSLIPFVKEFHETNSEVHILFTTTTVTAADIVEKRLGNLVIHQFMPFDVFMWIRRFIKYWKPKAAFFVESEIWPNALFYLYEKDIRTYLLNTRLSKRTINRMFKLKKIFNILPFRLFEKVFVPSDETKQIVKELGAKDAVVVPNIKIISPKLPINQKEQARLKNVFKDRKTWIAVSTHPGEEEIIINAHQEIKKTIPDLLTIIAIRHPDRALEVKGLCDNAGLSAVLHSEHKKNEPIESEVYILNQIGCLGEFFSIVDTVLICGSLIPGIGGHNFIESINFMCNTATGKYIDNFKDIYTYFTESCKVLENDQITDFVLNSFDSYERPKKTNENLNYSEKWSRTILQISKNIFG